MEKQVKTYVLSINAGSSSVKFALYEANNPPKRLLAGKIDRIGLPKTNLAFNDFTENRHGHRDIEVSDFKAAANLLLDWLREQVDLSSVAAVGHRVVHGMNYSEPMKITEKLLDELRRISPYDPQHLPQEIEFIEAFKNRYPNLLQAACFDTAFHRTMPRTARILPIPRRFDEMGIQRYGFHGLSYTYLLEELARAGGEKEANGRVILAHLGNGASMSAVREGKCIDTTMGFTPTGGLPMSTRTGDLDPGVAWFLMKKENMSAEQFNDLINRQSGLLGVSQTSPDMRDLLEKQDSDDRAAEAVGLFCYQARKWIGAFAAALGGLDTLVFSGGIGENSGEVRRRICAGLEFLGVELDDTKNVENAPVISKAGCAATVRVIKTDEELLIARTLCRILNNEKQGKNNNGGVL